MSTRLTVAQLERMKTHETRRSAGRDRPGPAPYARCENVGNWEVPRPL